MTTNATNKSRDQEDERKVENKLSQRFCKEDRLTGKIGEEIHEYIENYGEDVYGLHFSAHQRIKGLPNLCEGEAKRFYRTIAGS